MYQGNSFVQGHCYYNAKESAESPCVMICRKSLIYGFQLVPYTGLFKFPISCESAEVQAGAWVDCTEQVKRSEAMKNCDACPLVTISKAHVGTVIAFMDEGRVSPPHFLYAYEDGMAFLMTLDGDDKVFNLRLRQCYPLQQVYKDVSERAVSKDPLKSSIFDSFFGWLRKTTQYATFVSMVEDVPEDSKEDMIKLFELMSFHGVTAATFEAVVQERYNILTKAQKEGVSRYTAVLTNYKGRAASYSKVDREIMRATEFKYNTPREAWIAVGGGKPYPKSMLQINIEAPRTPHQYICDHLGLYDGNSSGFWFGKLCPALGDYLDMETQYKEGVDRYLKIYPEFDMSQLDFIKDEDKFKILRQYLYPIALDPIDPCRAWTKDPPPAIKQQAKLTPTLSYVEILREIYANSNLRHTYFLKEHDKE